MNKTFAKQLAVSSLSLVASVALFAMPASATTEGYGGSSHTDTFVSGGKGAGTGGGEAGCQLSLQAPATGFRVTIPNQNQTVTSQFVQLSIDGGNAKRMAISNSPSFDGASIEPYNNTKAWTLTSGEGVKTVYVRFYDDCGISTPVISATVNLSTTRTVGDQPTSDTTSTSGQVLGTQVSLLEQLIGSLRYGQSSADVIKLQTELVRVGALPRNWHVTRVYGATTLNAVNRYVDTHAVTIDTLVSSLSFGQNHPNVRRLQKDLRDLGFLPAGWRITSYYGTNTRAAVAKYNAGK